MNLSQAKNPPRMTHDEALRMVGEQLLRLGPNDFGEACLAGARAIRAIAEARLGEPSVSRQPEGI